MSMFARNKYFVYFCTYFCTLGISYTVLTLTLQDCVHVDLVHRVGKNKSHLAFPFIGKDYGSMLNDGVMI